MKKYEIAWIGLKEQYATPELEKMQNEGWEIAGGINLVNFDDRYNDPTFQIPLRREIKPED